MTLYPSRKVKSTLHVEPPEVYTPPLTPNDSRPCRVRVLMCHTMCHTLHATEKDLNSLCCKFTPGMVRLDILAV